MKHLKTIISMLTVLVVVSCAKSQSTGHGQVVFEVSSDDQVATMTKAKVSDYTTLPSMADFSITVTGEDYTWTGKISEWDASTQLLAGEYSVEAVYSSIETEGFDKPYFQGIQTFTVVGGEPVIVSIPVSLKNTIVRLEFSDYFKKYYKDYSFKISRANTEVVVFAKDETRAAFVDGYTLTLSGALTSENKDYSFSKEYTNLDEGTVYTFRFDVGNVGGQSITITFNEGYSDTIELGNYELND